MHVNGPYGCLQKMFKSCIDVFYASQILFTVIGHHPMPTEIDILTQDFDLYFMWK